jgi:uncharacterized protein (DUF2236 family)
VIRRVGNSPLTPFLGGGAATLLQVAHPLVAAGVVQHSDYRGDLWRRLGRTLRALYLITYGTKQEAERAADAGAGRARLRPGRIDVQLGRFPPGTPYAASDPELMLWVHATLVEASLAVYQRFVRTGGDRHRDARTLDAAGVGASIPDRVEAADVVGFRLAQQHVGQLDELAERLATLAR